MPAIRTAWKKAYFSPSHTELLNPQCYIFNVLMFKLVIIIILIIKEMMLKYLVLSNFNSNYLYLVYFKVMVICVNFLGWCVWLFWFCLTVFGYLNDRFEVKINCNAIQFFDDNLFKVLIALLLRISLLSRK